jgi:hypothetical protein
MKRRHLTALPLALGLVVGCGEGSLPTFENRSDQAIGSGPEMHVAAPRGRAPSIGAELVIITSEFAWTPGLHRAFVSTGSDSPIALCSVKDATNPGIILLVTCGHRVFNGQKGLILSVFFHEPPAPEDFVELVAYQEGALPFGPPVFAPIP